MTPRIAVFGIALAFAAGCTFTSLGGFSGGDDPGAGGPLGDASGGGDDGGASSDATTSTDGTTNGDANSACTNVSGLVGRWSFDQSTVSGTKVLDETSSATDGTMMGTGTLVTTSGRFGEALQFPSTDPGWLSVPQIDFDLASGASTTFSFWFLRGGDGAVDDALLYAPSSPRYDLWLHTQNSKDYLCVNTQNLDCWGFQSDDLRNRWVHVVAILVNGPVVQSSLWIDGAKKTLACHTAAGFGACDKTRTIGTPVTFGGETDFPFRGKMDEMRVYARALTDVEIKLLFEGRACP